MEIFVERGVSRADCAGKIQEECGPWFNILREKKIRMGGFLGIGTHEGVEVEYYIPPRALKTQAASAPVQFPGTPASASPSVAMTTAATAADWQDTNGSTLNFEEAKKRVLAAAGRDPEQIVSHVARDSSQQRILDELREIKERINSGAEKKEEHPSLMRMGQMLKLNDFSERYTAAMLERARKEMPLETLENFNEAQDHLLEWIGESISVYEEPPSQKSGRILVLVGPTGVGKTTTIAKLAAVYGLGYSGKPPMPVRMITIDAFRIGARTQIETYGSIMDIPVSYVDNRRDLRRELALYQDETGIILIDTIGKSPKNSAKLGEMKEILDACGSKAEVHLVMSASTKTSDIEHILRQFEPFNYSSVVLTKLDETSHTGNVISALAERNKSVSWMTDGQDVPNDIKKASAVRFLINLDEFKVNREKIEKRFSLEEAEQLKWS
ncbi:MAG: flagellar biosynthesis protein FlhF [Treponema sp.]|jgi:flagellar biosynthesis protein FlhF|nr:flagellar biosynthesis protein FlhF [Treponema sp.]